MRRVECVGFVGDLGASTHPPPPSSHLTPVALQPPKEPRQKYPQKFLDAITSPAHIPISRSDNILEEHFFSGTAGPIVY